MINSRNQSGQAPYRIVSVSSDSGVNFSAGQLNTTLIDPVCEGSLLNISWNGKPYLVFSNPASKTSRDYLSIRYSKDDGANWSSGFLITAGASAYSDLSQINTQNIGIIYENGSAGIRFMKIPLSSIITTP